MDLEQDGSLSLRRKRQRRRRTLACEECRRRKVRCDREQPCNNCVQAYKPEQCYYQPDPMVARPPPPPPPGHAGHVRLVSNEMDGSGGAGAGSGYGIQRRGSAESDWPESMSMTATSATGTANGTGTGASVAGSGTPGRFGSLLPPLGGGRPGGGGSGPASGGGSSSAGHSAHHPRYDDYRSSVSTYASPSVQASPRGPLPSVSALSGESEVSSLREQVWRLENRLALVLNDHEEPHHPPPPLPPPPPPPPPLRHPHYPHHLHPHHPHHGHHPHHPHHRGHSPPHHRHRYFPHHPPPPYHSPYHPPHHYPPPPPPPFSHRYPPLPPPPPPPMSDMDLDRDDDRHRFPPPPPGHMPDMPSPSATLPPLQPQFPASFYNRNRRPSDSATSDGGGGGGGPRKARYIGQGHWMNGALLSIMKPLLREVLGKPGCRDRGNDNGDLYQNMEQCKSLGRAIKAFRAPSLPAVAFGQHMPARAVADALVNSYFHTFETVYRIMHIPTFQQDYRRYWENPAAACSNFVIQMQLCMAIGTAFYDDTCSLRPLATQWISEAQFWLMMPSSSEKSRMNLPGLQTMCLLHLAREVCGVGADLAPISASGLVRSAMYLGLHRDPSKGPRVSRYLTEIRRRLWATILEIALQSSLDSGGPPPIALADFDTLPPANFYDDQLSDKATAGTTGVGAASAPSPPKPLTTFTNTSIQIALFKSFPTRLAVARHVNDLRNSTSYDEASRLNAELRSACQVLTGTIQAFRPTGAAGKLRPSSFQLSFVSHLTQRCFLSLNQVFLAASQNDPKYYFSRKISVDTSLKLYEAWSGKAAAAAVAEDGEPDYFHRLSVSGASGFRYVPVQCIATLSMDLLWQLEDEHAAQLHLAAKPADRDGGDGDQGRDDHVEDGSSSSSSSNNNKNNDNNSDTVMPAVSAMPGVLPQSVLIEALERAVGYSEKRLRAGETNVKCYLFPCAVVAQARALARGASAEDMKAAVVGECSKRLQHCVGLMREVMAQQAAAGRRTAAHDGDGGDSGGGGGGAALSTSIASDAATRRPSDKNSATLLARSPGNEHADVPMDGSTAEWGWEELMQTFDFSPNMNDLDSFFADI